MKPGFAVIFDLNGTLVDTEKAYFQAYHEVLSQYGIEFTMTIFTDFWTERGQTLSDYLETIGRNDLLKFVPELLSEKDRFFQDSIKKDLTVMPGSKKLILELAEKQVPLGLDSSTTEENILIMLQNIGVSEMFSVIASGDMVLDEKQYGNKKQKSARLRYLADQLGASPSNTIAIGDADKDLRGAKDAGMKFVAVPNSYTSNQDLSLADLQAKSLVELTYPILVECFAAARKLL